MNIYFDLDGTLNKFYNVEGWLDDLMNERTRPYDIAEPALNMSLLARLLHKAQAKGHRIGIISWTSRGGSDLYNGEVALAKMVWLHKHLPSVEWDEIKIVRYGTDKRTACGGGILFDDEEPNRKTWGDGAFTPDEIIRVLKGI